jgi:hypothetical protein
VLVAEEPELPSRPKLPNGDVHAHEHIRNYVELTGDTMPGKLVQTNWVISSNEVHFQSFTE